ncbi:MAG: uroporphyrinogen-III C-methyltransferase [Woeseiaceae bacterium]
MTDEQQASSEEQALEAATPELPPETADKAEKEDAQGSGSGKRLLWIILLIIVIAAAIFGWQKFSVPADEQPDPVAAVAANDRDPQPLATGDIIESASLADVDNLQRDVSRLNDRLDTLTAALEDATREVASQATTTQSLQSEIRDRVDLLDSLPGRVRNTEEALVTLQGVSAGSRNAWLTAEAEYYLQIANAQMQLANNPSLAASALELADQRVRELADPSYTAVRRQIATELASLRAIDKSDIEGVTLTLGSLAAIVPTLPLNRGGDRDNDADDDSASDVSGWARVKQSTGNFFSSMVRIRETEEQVRPMLSPDAEYFLRLNLQLQLQAARLSLLLGETASYQQTLQDAESWIDQYFDTRSTAVSSAKDMLQSSRDLSLISERPDISGSLRLLRQLKEVGAISE